MNKFFSSIIIIFIITLILSSTYIFYPQLPQSFDNKIRDFMFNIRGEIKPKSDSVVIVDIDEKSLQTLGQWPWSRDKLSQILRNLNDSEVAIIGLDIVFAEEDRTSPHKLFKKYNIHKEDVPNYDFEFAQTVAYTPTILGYQFEFADKKFIKKESPSIKTIFIEKNKSLGEDYLIKAKGTILNIPIIQDNSYSSGFFNNIPDDSGIIRSVPLIISYDEMIYPSLALETLRIALGIKKVFLNYDENGVNNIQLNDLSIPTDRYGRVMVNFRGKEKSFKYISAADIYNNTFNKNEIANKIVLIGTSAAALMDLRATPFESIFPGVEVHANVIDNILSQDYLYKPSWIEAVNILLIFVLTFFTYYTVKKIPIIFTPLYIFTLLFLVFYFIYYLLFNYGLIINSIFLILGIIISAGISLVIEYFYETKIKEDIKNKFASKVSKDVMEQLINNTSNKNQLQSRNETITVFFSDIRSFTSISEDIKDPELLVSYLNKYMTPMSDIIIKNKGTIDKYIGDAIMAYWNAPFNIKNHEDLALKSAIEQINILEELNKTLIKENFPKIQIGIGITTGKATVGEIGSMGRSDFTVIGDTINLGSRVESLCKYYGANIIITDDTKINLKENYHYRYLDYIKVKGKNNAIKIWEVIDFYKKDENLSAELETYEKALEHYYKKEFLLALKLFEKLTLSHKNKIYLIFKNRTIEYLNSPSLYSEIYTHENK